MKKIIIFFFTLFIVLASSIYADNGTDCGANVIWCDRFDAITDWTVHQGSFDVFVVDGDNVMRSTGGISSTYTNSLVSYPNTKISVMFDYQEPSGTYGYYYQSKDGQYSSAANSYFAFWVSDTGGDDSSLKVNNIGPVSADYDYDSSTWYTYCFEMHPTFMHLYVNGSFVVNQTGFTNNLSEYVDNGFRTDASNSYYDNLIIYEGTCLNPPTGGSPPLSTTVIYPQETVYNASFNLSVVLETNMAATCDLNGSWVLDASNGTLHTFTIGSLADGNHTIAYYCNDTATTWDNSTFWVFYDGNSPTSVLYTPQNGATYDSDFTLNISFSDPYLYAVNISITNSTNHTLYYYSSGNITNGTTILNITSFFNISTIVNGSVLTLFREATDSHTANVFREELKYTRDRKGLTTDKITYNLDYTDFSIEYPKALEITPTKTTDRFTFEYSSSTIRGETYFDIESERIDYLPDSDYLGHFIIYGDGVPKYWFDTEGLLQTRIEQLSRNKYRIYYIHNKETTISRSLGGLNYINWTTTFTIGPSAFGNVRIEVHPDNNALMGVCNISDLNTNSAFFYTWWLDGVNISSGWTGEGITTKNVPDNWSESGNWKGTQPASNCVDGNFWTFCEKEPGLLNADLYVNYTIPSTENASIYYHHISGFYTDPIPDSCINDTILQLRIRSFNSSTLYGVEGTCYNGTAYQPIFNKTGAVFINTIFYEEKVIFNSNYTYYNFLADNYISNMTATEPGQYVFQCRAFNGTNYSIAYNSSSYYYPTLNIKIYNEMNLSYMNIATVPEVRLDVFCNDSLHRYKINSSSTALNITCFYDYVNLWFVYNNSNSYYRTLVPSYGVTNPLYSTAPFYMINLYNDTAVLWDVGLLDIIGDYAGQAFFVTKLTANNGTIEVIRQYPDIQEYVHLYLVKHETYALNIYSNAGVLRVIGNIEASEAAEKIATLPQISFKPDTYLSDDIGVSEDFDTDAGIFRVNYGDSSGLTEWVSITITNVSDSTQIFDSYNTTVQNFSYTYAPIFDDIGYFYDLEYCHQSAGCHQRKQTLGIPTLPGVPGGINMSWMFQTGVNITKIKKAMGPFIIVGTALLFPAEYVLVGAVFMLVEFAVLPFFGLLDISPMIVGLYILMMVLLIGRGVLKERK